MGKEKLGRTGLDWFKYRARAYTLQQHTASFCLSGKVHDVNKNRWDLVGQDTKDSKHPPVLHDSSQVSSNVLTRIRIGKKIYLVKSGINGLLNDDRNSIKPSTTRKAQKANIVPQSSNSGPAEPDQAKAKARTEETLSNASCASPENSSEGNIPFFRHSITDNPRNKPFLTKDSTMTVSRAVDGSNKFPPIHSILNATKCDTYSRNTVLSNDAAIRKLGPEGFAERRKDLTQDASDFNALMKEYLKNGDDSLCVVSPLMEGYWESFKPALKEISNPHCIYETTTHPHLGYSGTVKCIAFYRSLPVLVDWVRANSPYFHKSSRSYYLNSKKPFNLMACGGALNFDPNFSHQISKFLLIVGYADGSPAVLNLFTIDDAQVVWKSWLRRLQIFQDTRKQADVASIAEITDQIDCLFGPNEMVDIQSQVRTKSMTSPSPVDTPINPVPELGLKVQNSDQKDCSPKSTSEAENLADDIPINPVPELGLKVQNSDQKDCSPKSTSEAQKLANEVGSKPKQKKGLLDFLWNVWKS